MKKKIYLLIGGLGAVTVVGIGVLSFSLSRSGSLVKPGREVAFQPETNFDKAQPEALEEVKGEATSSAVVADLILNFGVTVGDTKNIATYSAERSEKGTALDLLLTQAAAEGFKVEYENQDFGVFIKSIKGVNNTKDHFWLFYINGQMAPVAADKQALKNGDRVEFRYSTIEDFKQTGNE